MCFKPRADEFVRAENELQALLDRVGVEQGARISRRGDAFGFEWLIADERDLERQASVLGALADGLPKEQLLAAVFPFDRSGKRVFLIYGFKRGTFWPFVPTGEEKQRDNEQELELKKQLEKHVPIEPELSRWLALFDAPV